MLTIVRAWLNMMTLAFDKGGDPPAPPPAPTVLQNTPSTITPFGSQIATPDPSNPGGVRVTTTLSPEQQKLYEGRTGVANALLGRTSTALDKLPVGYNFSGASDPSTNRFFTAQKALLDPVFARDEEALTQRLANQGIPMGSEAYDREVTNFRKSKDAAYEQAAADALSKGFSQDIATRQQNLNEVAQALGGSQLTPVGSADISNAVAANQAGVNRAYQGELAGYNANVAAQNQLMGGLFGLGQAGIGAYGLMHAAPALAAVSDRRLKREIERTGEFMPGIGWYSFRYVWDGADEPVRQGVMADEVGRVMPDAVLRTRNGFAMVDYGRLFASRRLG